MGLKKRGVKNVPLFFICSQDTSAKITTIKRLKKGALCKFYLGLDLF